MCVLAIGIEYPRDVSVERSDHTNPREHGWAAQGRDEDQGFHKGKLPLVGQPWSSHSKCLRYESCADVGIPSTGLMIVSRKVRHANKPGER
jgi:hypothetical protein